MELENDISKTKEVIWGLKNQNYSHIYVRTNEDLKELFKHFSVKDKKVLTVLASSDQMFCSYYLGAKSVDTFDINKLQMYYYYIRKWLLEYRGDLYPSKSEIVLSNEWIYNLVNLVEVKSTGEEKAYKYWRKYLGSIPGYMGKDLFYFSNISNRTMLTDLEKLREIVCSFELSFKCQDICGEIDKSHKYDIVILSNILEYASYDRKKMEVCRDNLYDILEDGGEVICTNLIDSYFSCMEAAVFREKFYEKVFYYSSPISNKKIVSKPIGYCYCKKS